MAATVLIFQGIDRRVRSFITAAHLKLWLFSFLNKMDNFRLKTTKQSDRHNTNFSNGQKRELLYKRRPLATHHVCIKCATRHQRVRSWEIEILEDLKKSILKTKELPLSAEVAHAHAVYRKCGAYIEWLIATFKLIKILAKDRRSKTADSLCHRSA